MTREDVLARVREVRPNEFTDEWALAWIDELDQRILRELAQGYLIPETGGELIAVPPYDAIYAEYIMAQIDLANSEYDRYNNDMALFNARWDELGRYISRNWERERPSRYRI